MSFLPCDSGSITISGGTESNTQTEPLPTQRATITTSGTTIPQVIALNGQYPSNEFVTYHERGWGPSNAHSIQMNNDNQNTDTDTEYTAPFENEHREALYAFVRGSVETEFAAEQHSVNTIFELLANPGRRYVLTYVLQSEGFVTISELVDYVTTKTTSNMTDDEFRRKITVELSHTYLPDLEEEGFIRYNMERQLILPTEKTPMVEPYLRLALLQSQFADEQLETPQ